MHRDHERRQLSRGLHELDLADAFKVFAFGVGYGYAGEIRSEGSLDYAEWDQMTIVR